jgi:hypothetical protein
VRSITPLGIYAYLVAGLLSPAMSAGDVPSFEKPVFLVAPILRDEIAAGVVDFYRGELTRAFEVLHRLAAPGTRSPFGRGTVAPSNTTFYITVSQDDWVVSQHVPRGEETALISVETESDGPHGWMQFYIVDRIYFGAQHKLKAGAFADLLAAAAYQNYGTLPFVLANGLLHGERTWTESQRLQMREFAISHTISFLERVLATSTVKLTPVERLRVETLLRERRTDLLRLRCKMATQ